MQGNLEDLIVAQMMGHSSAAILQTYAKVIDGVPAGCHSEARSI